MGLKLSKYLITFPEDTTVLHRADKLLLFSTRTARLMKISAFVYQLLANGNFEELPDALLIKLVENEIIICAEETEFESIVEKHIAIAADLRQSSARHSRQETPDERENARNDFSELRKFPPVLQYAYDAGGKKEYFFADLRKLLGAHAPMCCNCINLPVCGAKVPKLPGTYEDCPVNTDTIRNLMADALLPIV